MNTMKTLIPLMLLFLCFFFSSSAPLDQMENERAEEDASKPEKRSKLAAFLLSFFLGGFGADWFYLSRGDFVYIMVGIIKLLLIGQAGFCCCSLKFEIFSCNERMMKCLGPCRWILSLATLLWWVVDWIRVLTDNFPDGNMMGLLQDMYV